MIALPTPGELVTFQLGEGHRVPKIGRPKEFYSEGTDIEERWTQQHVGRLRTGAIVLVKWSAMPKTAEVPLDDK